MLTALLIVTLSGLFHEVGHAAACYRYVGSVGTSGFKLDYVLPSIYVDVSCIHLIDDGWKKIIVGISGIYFQIIFILPFYFFNFFNGEVQSAIFGFTAFLIIFNLIPMKGSDGYWIIYDLMPKAKAHRFWRDTVYVKFANVLKFVMLSLIVTQAVRLLLHSDFPLLSSPPFSFLIFTMLSIIAISHFSKFFRYVYGRLNPKKM